MLFEHQDGKQSTSFESEILPQDAVAFTYFQQNSRDENGKCKTYQYRIGVPIKFIIGDMYIQLDTSISDKDDIYCLSIENGKRRFIPCTKDTILVKNFLELKSAYYDILNIKINDKLR